MLFCQETTILKDFLFEWMNLLGQISRGLATMVTSSLYLIAIFIKKEKGNSGLKHSNNTCNHFIPLQ